MSEEQYIKRFNPRAVEEMELYYSSSEKKPGLSLNEFFNRKEYYHNMINDHKIGIYPQSKLITPKWASKMIDKFYNPEIEKFKYFKWTEINQSGY